MFPPGAVLVPTPAVFVRPWSVHSEVREDGITALMLADEYGRIDVAKVLRGDKAAAEDPDDPFRYPDHQRAMRPQHARTQAGPAQRGRPIAAAGPRASKNPLSSAARVLQRLGGPPSQ